MINMKFMCSTVNKLFRERVSSLVVTIAPVAPQVLVRLPVEGISQDLTAFVLLVVGDVLIDSETHVVTQSSKMLLGVGFACVYS
jgi:hypothetical protein